MRGYRSMVHTVLCISPYTGEYLSKQKGQGSCLDPDHVWFSKF